MKRLFATVFSSRQQVVTTREECMMIKERSSKVTLVLVLVLVIYLFIYLFFFVLLSLQTNTTKKRKDGRTQLCEWIV